MKADWKHIYPPEKLPQVIQKDKPGVLIANSISELQERVVVRVKCTDGQIDVKQVGNDVFISLTPTDLQEEVDTLDPLPSTAGKSKWMQLTLVDDAGTKDWDWTRAHG